MATSLRGGLEPLGHDARAPLVVLPDPPAPTARDLDGRAAVHRRALVLADLAAGVVAGGAAALVAGTDAPWTLVAGVPLTCAVARAAGMHGRDELLLRRPTLDEAPQLLQLATLTAFLLSLGGPALGEGRLPPASVLALWGVLVVALVLCRSASRRVATRLARAERCLVVGDPAVTERLAARLERAPGLRLVGRLPFDAAVGDFEAVRGAAGHVAADRLLIAPSEHTAHARTLDVIRAAKGIGMRVSIVPEVLDVVGSSLVVDELDGMVVVGLRRFGLRRSSRALKRSLDIAGATFGLVVLSPALATIALAVRLSSPGPVLYRQLRVGRDGRPFTICKFRTMVDGAHAQRPALAARNEAVGGLFKMADDPRVTRVGRLLRRSSLDELPQLLNVLVGEMSLVGPRPLVLDEDATIVGLDRRRLVLTPGMTGPWQIAGSARIPLPEMVKMDYLYVAGWSLWNDVKVLLRTAAYVLARRGQ